MPVLIDPPNWPGHGRFWSHLVSDQSLEELHGFARRLGLRSFDADHYDVPSDRHAEAVAAGAQVVSGRELLQRLTASGLRVPKRKREWLLQSGPAAGGQVREILASPFDHLARLPAGGRIHVLDCRAVTMEVGTVPPGDARPVAVVRIRDPAGSTARIVEVVYAVNHHAPSRDRLGELRGHQLWPVVAWVRDRL